MATGLENLTAKQLLETLRFYYEQMDKRIGEDEISDEITAGIELNLGRTGSRRICRLFVSDDARNYMRRESCSTRYPKYTRIQLKKIVECLTDLCNADVIVFTNTLYGENQFKIGGGS